MAIINKTIIPTAKLAQEYFDAILWEAFKNKFGEDETKLWEQCKQNISLQGHTMIVKAEDRGFNFLNYNAYLKMLMPYMEYIRYPGINEFRVEFMDENGVFEIGLPQNYIKETHDNCVILISDFKFSTNNTLKLV